ENRFSGVSRITLDRSGETDDQGRYEIAPLNEGTYFIAAKATPWYAVHPPSVAEGSPSAAIQVDSNLDVAYPITFYGDTTDADDATPIPIRGGDRLEADIHLRPAGSLHLLFHVTQGGFSVPRIQAPVFDGAEEMNLGTVQTVSDGTYEVTGIPAGRYLVRMPDSDGRPREPSSVDLTSNQELD